MELFNLLFFIFSFLTVLSALLVISVKNPIHSVLYLILVFCGSSGILLMLGVEFLGLMFIVVYVGAIAVLFLFVIMMLNIKIIELNENLISYLPISALLIVLLLLEFFILLDKNFLLDLTLTVTPYTDWYTSFNAMANVNLIGLIIYTWLFPAFVIMGLCLLVAMIGPIVLTLNQYKYVLRQNIFEQNLRN
ncbi:UNVERIFIED_CONTAM: hypothetical protein GTU68_058002 [Idotea baltica]|nr:hypothetical protein [Idotea baltica]